jgi:Tfp pilus assembly protein FimT
MKGLPNRYKEEGFTILEVLVVLAVTMVVFFIAASFVNGRQGQVEFNNSVSALKSELVQVINNTTNGNFPNQLYTCTGNTVPPAQPTITSGTSSDTGQGTHDTCVFLGKVLEFTTNKLNIYTVIGNSIAASSSSTTATTTNYSQIGAKPTIAPTSVIPSEIYSYQGASTVSCQQFSTISTISTNIPATCSISSPQVGLGALALLVGNNQANNAQLTNLVIPSSGAGSVSPGSPTFVSDVNTATGTSLIESTTSPSLNINPLGGTQVCLTSGTSNESALFTIGGNGNESSVTSHIFQDTTCT